MTMQTVMRPLNGQTISYDNTSGGVNNSTAFTNPTVRVKTTSDAYIKFGAIDVNVSSSDYDIHLSANTEYDFSTGGAAGCSIIQDSASGTAYISEWTHKAI